MIADLLKLRKANSKLQIENPKSKIQNSQEAIVGDVKTASVKWVEGHEFQTFTGSGHQSVIDSSVASSGKNHGPSPMELLLVGMAGCTGIDVIDILGKKRLDVKGLEVRIEGTRAETYPMVYTEINVVYVVRGKDIPERAVEQAIHLSEEKYCGAGAMLAKTAKINHRYEIVSE
ncbi:MAG: OsmC family protein [Chloroflexi bacterium]|nr:OsmC family protein [Chloroflexota bacterium]